MARKPDPKTLAALEKRLLWLASWTIHNANHLRAAGDMDIKVGGHQASCASSVSILSDRSLSQPAVFCPDFSGGATGGRGC